jgi:tetratricopeptide (TPR) repeat protein
MKIKMPKKSQKHQEKKYQSQLNRAIFLHQSGNIDEAQEIYLGLLDKNSNNADINFLLGVIGIQKKEWLKSTSYINNAINLSPENCKFYYHRALANYELGDLKESILDYGLAIDRNPAYIEAYLNRGVAEQQMQNYEAAIQSYNSVIDLNSDYIAAYLNRSEALFKLLRFEESIVSCDIAITLKPDFAEAYFNKGNALQALKIYDEAIENYKIAVKLNPGYIKAIINLGMCELKLKKYETAQLNFQLALQINPDYPEAHLNLGGLFRELRLFDNARASLDNAIVVRPGYAEAYFNKSLIDLALGNFDSGWPLYEWRWKSEETPLSPLTTSKPPFNPNLAGRRVLIWAEQGIGDEIMFASLLNRFRHLCQKLLVAVDARLVELFRRSFKDIEFYDKALSVPEDLYDEHLAMGGMCQYLLPSPLDLNSAAPAYLQADDSRSRDIRASLGIDSTSRLCGISWRTSNQKFVSRNLELKRLIAALEAPNIKFVSLQYGETQKEIDTIAADLGIQVLTYKDVDNFQDIDGLAAIINACDLVVSIDNTTVHLGGALGKPVNVLLPFDSDWRWMTKGDKSYWYASVRLFRQGSDWDWTPLLEQVRKKSLLMIHA